MKLKFRVDQMTEEEIRQFVDEFDGDIVVESVDNPASTSLRKKQGIEPFTYFVVVFAAHLAAAATHDAVGSLKKRFANKNIKQIEDK